MTYLAVDTATELLLIMVYKNGQTYTYLSPQPGQNHSSALFPALEALLSESSSTLQEMDFLACATGPGSFTGLRIGLSALKGLAEALNKPLIGFSSLDAMGWESRHLGDKSMPVIDARKGKFYVGLYHKGERIGELMDLPADKISALLADQGQVCLTGYQGQDLATVLGRNDGQNLLKGWFSGISHHVEEAWLSGSFLEPDAGPLYIRLSEAEENRLTQS